MALTAIPPRDDSRREEARYAADLQDAKDRPYAWGAGANQVPENIIHETVTYRTVERPAPVPEPTPIVAQVQTPAPVPPIPPVAPNPQPAPEPAPVQGRPLSAKPGVFIGPDGRAEYV
jgi:outer membrane biosynthesis protein TonB